MKLLATYFNVTTDYLLDFQAGGTKDHSEDALLRLYRSLPPEQKTLYLDGGKLLPRHALKEQVTHSEEK